jgi:hypothetical protein
MCCSSCCLCCCCAMCCSCISCCIMCCCNTSGCCSGGIRHSCAAASYNYGVPLHKPVAVTNQADFKRMCSKPVRQALIKQSHSAAILLHGTCARSLWHNMLHDAVNPSVKPPCTMLQDFSTWPVTANCRKLQM